MTMVTLFNSKRWKKRRQAFVLRKRQESTLPTSSCAPRRRSCVAHVQFSWKPNAKAATKKHNYTKKNK